MMYHDIADLVFDNRTIPSSTVRSFCFFMSNVETNSCGHHISFAFPNPGTYHDITRDRLDLFLTALASNTTIKALSLVTEQHAQTDDDFSEMWNAIGQAFGSMPNLQEVTFQRTNAWDINAVARILCHLTNITKLNIVFYSFFGGQILLDRLNLEQTQQLCTALSKCSKLEEANLISVASESTNEFFVGLSQLPNLRHLVFSCHPFDENTSIQADSLRPFFHSKTLLQSLNLAHLNLDETNCQQFAAAVKNGIAPTSLRLEECQFETPTIVWKAAKSNLHIQELRLEYTTLEESMIDALVQYLSNNTTLDDFHLVLVRPPRGTTPQSRVGRLFSFLTDNHRLRSLSVYSLPMKSDDLLSLGHALAQNQSLVTLDVHGDVSDIQSSDLITFASKLALNRHLKGFDLSGFPVLPLDQEKDGDAFLQYMKQNVTLERFTMSMPSVSSSSSSSSRHNKEPRWLDELQSYIRLNLAGRKYILDDSSNLYQCTKVLGAVRNDLDCLYLHLRENPNICNEHCHGSIKKQRIK